MPIEQYVAEKLRKKFVSLQSQPTQLIREFQRFVDLLQRENMQKYLSMKKKINFFTKIIYIKYII